MGEEEKQNRERMNNKEEDGKPEGRGVKAQGLGAMVSSLVVFQIIKGRHGNILDHTMWYQ